MTSGQMATQITTVPP